MVQLHQSQLHCPHQSFTAHTAQIVVTQIQELERWQRTKLIRLQSLQTVPCQGQTHQMIETSEEVDRQLVDIIVVQVEMFQ